LSGIDIAFALFILLGAYHGYKAGFLLELFALVAVVLGVLGGFKLMGWTMVHLGAKFNVGDKVLPYVAFALVFFLIVIVVNLLGKLIKASVDKSFLGSIDQAAGGLLGLLRTIFMLSVVLWIVDSLKLEFLSDWTADSWLYQIVAGFAPKFTDWISELLPAFKDVL
jgi:membrane protein required for colicin V production